MSRLPSYRDAVLRTLPPRDRLLALGGRSLRFSVWQILAQSVQLTTGFLLIRWLSYDAYAQYGLTIGFQTTLAILVDLGLTGAILALVGQRINDPQVMSRYMGAAWRQRTWLLLIIVPVSAPVFFWLGHSHGWPAGSIALLFTSIIASLFFQGLVGIYVPALVTHHQWTSLFRPSVSLGVARLLVLQGLQVMSWLGAAVVCWINVLVALAAAALYRPATRPYGSMPRERDAEAEREMRKYLAPLIPGAIFYAFQGQIQLFLIAFFGSVQSVAEVAALGRLGALFAFFLSFIHMLLIPLVARAPLEQLANRYALVLGGTVLVGGGIAALALVYPNPLLLILGRQVRRSTQRSRAQRNSRCVRLGCRGPLRIEQCAEVEHLFDGRYEHWGNPYRAIWYDCSYGFEYDT